ncbi:UBA/THIF-type NAD/FAD binding protein [Desulforamulus reducens MI-1]|uniref:UBA/THIF-type NAD/FAD binding protein n=1 Tax=Desulforamulus reducens (strain ATCC BAA-1160 / DSM 100696 / MI-1) TaxID=349161 RepID=A4J6S2_DESRM|nr:UBA/THIF-type NAD/FAD binding protein [Desulforamulus reducens MI-1]
MSIEQKKRYHRNIMLSGVGEEGQLKLLHSSVLVVGTGGLGSPVAYYLAAAGIGRLGLIDADVVDCSNLQRQIVHGTPDIGRFKVESAREKLLQINPDIDIRTYPHRMTEDNAEELVEQYHIVVDATDNLESRYILNKACINQKKPFIYGGVLSMVGQVMTIVPGKGPCFRCIFRELPGKRRPKGTDEVGILGSVAGTIGSIQATEVIKYLLGQGELLIGRLLTMDARSMSFADVEVKKDAQCPDCGHLKRDYGEKPIC